MGCGVAKYDGMIVFCDGAVEGDTAEVKIISRKANYATAHAEKILASSEHRIEPLCPYFGKCGGCAFSNVTYEHELNVKKRGIESAFRRCGSFFAKVDGIIYDNEYNYRNKAVFRFDNNKNIGFFAKKSNDFIKIEKCLAVDSSINIIMKECEKLLKNDNSIFSGDLTYLYIRYAQQTNEASVVIGYKGQKILFEFADHLLKKLSFVKCVMQGKEKNPESKKEKLRLIGGAPQIENIFSSLKFKISPDAFFQINQSVAEKICSLVADCAKLRENDIFLDMYCGTGIIGLSVAVKYPKAKIIGVEINESAVKNAVDTAKANGILNTEFHCSDSAQIANVYNGKVACLAVDPPRAGLSDTALKEIQSFSPERIIYVSCNPSTLSRDIKGLLCNYKIEKVIAADLFPRTSHVETIAILNRKFSVHDMRLNSSPFEMIQSGKKTIELRLFDEKRQQVKIGDRIVFTNTATGETINTTVVNLHRFDTFKELYKSLPLLKCGYTAENVGNAKPSDMEQYYSVEEQNKYGVVGIELCISERITDKTTCILSKKAKKE